MAEPEADALLASEISNAFASADVTQTIPVAEEAATSASTIVPGAIVAAGTAAGVTQAVDPTALSTATTAVASGFSSASIDVSFQNIYGQTILSGVCVPGKLDTNKLENGDYIIPTIVKTFQYLKTIKYNNSIIENIKNKLSAFLSAITMSNQITDYTTKISQQVFAGTLSNDDFNKSVSSYTKNLSDNYPNNYFMNLSKVQKAINDNLHILTDK